MLVKTRDKQMSFLFQEHDPFFEIGCRILEQEQIEEMLPYRIKHQNGRNKLVFKADGENLIPLKDVVPELGENDLVNLLCGMISLNLKVEENGFLKKECIWYRYDNIYYDRENKCIRAAVLPITGGFRYADDSGWYDCFEGTMVRIASCLQEDKEMSVRKLVLMLKTGKFTQEEALEELRLLGGNTCLNLPCVHEGSRNLTLKLLYRGRNRDLEFQVDGDDFLIGRNAAAVDGVITPEFSRAVSRKHCLILKMNHKYFVQDLKSVNHTLVNGIAIPPYELMELENNDILSVADMEFRVTTSVS